MSDGAQFIDVSPASIPAIDACLPQTQCTQCGYPRCREYATALFHKETELNRCPPGGVQTITALARLLGRKVVPLDTACGMHKPRVLAFVIEEQCIGCKLCIQACPLDAIVGRAKRMHTVLPTLCTGCELCLPVCPVDCIDLIDDKVHPVDPESPWPDYAEMDVRTARRNTVTRLRRMCQIARQREQNIKARAATQSQRMRSEIQAAVARVKHRQSQR